MDCVLCHPQKENVVWKNKELRVIQVDDPLFPGYFRVIWNKHIAEMSDLTDDERQLLEKVLLTVEKVVREQMQPDKINWAQFGNMVPHLHWHIIARYRDDSHFPESIWGLKQREVAEEKVQQLKTKANNAAVEIQNRLNRLF
ncbi:HIT family protein [Parasutterella secunda]|jgi:diadenosine tetraphosphate (Ap4A) HIT family hydrolase|uniref:HIT family protein n=1 Tax=Parasutterella secunda TaxID=626947 RepID=UPI00033E292F|nr:HIT family protein [Parasutterella secunda]CDE77012.1 hIT family hydrolase [Sutterella sp. CAG:521]HIR20756.1 HIT family protein [Candidatus Aphodousia faecalis]MCL1596102.1 HIT family protein [Parasutterella secunda]MDM8087434.1 HIT family protein [Parasutterella secunda]MDM8112275.1 HIT family protein [Parasutterella secunda]